MIELYPKYDDPIESANYFFRNGKKFMNEGQWKLAAEHFEAFLEQFKLLDNLEGMAEGFRILGVVYSHLERGEESEAYLNKALEMNKAFDDPQREAFIYRNFASSYMRLEKMELSEKYYLKAIEINRAISNSSALLSDHCSLGFLFQRRERYEDAMQHLYLALSYSENPKLEPVKETIDETLRYIKKQVGRKQFKIWRKKFS